MLSPQEETKAVTLGSCFFISKNHQFMCVFFSKKQNICPEVKKDHKFILVFEKFHVSGTFLTANGLFNSPPPTQIGHAAHWTPDLSQEPVIQNSARGRNR